MEYTKGLEHQNELLLERCKLLESQVEFYKRNIHRSYIVAADRAMSIMQDKYMEIGMDNVMCRIASLLMDNDMKLIRVARQWGRRYPWGAIITKTYQAAAHVDIADYTVEFSVYVSKNAEDLDIFNRLNCVKRVVYNDSGDMVDNIRKYLDTKNFQ